MVSEGFELADEHDGAFFPPISHILYIDLHFLSYCHLLFHASYQAILYGQGIDLVVFGHWDLEGDGGNPLRSRPLTLAQMNMSFLRGGEISRIAPARLTLILYFHLITPMAIWNEPGSFSLFQASSPILSKALIVFSL